MKNKVSLIKKKCNVGVPGFKHQATKMCEMVELETPLHIFNLGTSLRLRWVVSLMLQLLYLSESYPLHRKLERNHFL